MITYSEEEGQDNYAFIKRHDISFQEDVDDHNSVDEFFKEWCQNDILKVQQTYIVRVKFSHTSKKLSEFSQKQERV